MAKVLRQNILKGVLGNIHKRDLRSETYSKEKIEKILLINTTAIGDTLMCTPAIRALRETFPKVRIEVVAGSSARLVLTGNPRIDQIIEYPDKVDLRYLMGLRGLIRRLRSFGPDLAIVLHGNDPDAVPLAYMSRARFRMGMAKTDFPFLLDWYKPLWTGGHLVRLRLEALKDLGIDCDNTEMELFLSDKEQAEADSIIKAFNIDGPMAAIHPFGSKRTRQWSLKRAAELGDLLYEKDGLYPVLLGGPKEIAGSREVASMMKTKPLITAGAVPLRVSAAIIKRCSVLVSTDSGPMHVGQAVGTPTVAIVGSTLAESTGPIEESAVVVSHPESCDVKRPCKRYDCDHIICMDSVTTKEVLDGVRRICRVHT